MADDSVRSGGAEIQKSLRHAGRKLVPVSTASGRLESYAGGVGIRSTAQSRSQLGSSRGDLLEDPVHDRTDERCQPGIRD